MNTLETLKGMLRKKDNVIANEGVKVTLIGVKTIQQTLYVLAVDCGVLCVNVPLRRVHTEHITRRNTPLTWLFDK